MKKKKVGKLLPLLLAVIDAVLAVIIIGAYRKTTVPDTVPDETAAITEQVNDSENTPATAAATEPTSENVSETQETSEKQETTVQPDETEADTTVTEPTEAPTQEPATEKISYSTDARPTTDDFLGWYTSDVMWNGAPAGVTRLTELSDILGGWKGLIYYDPENTEDSEAIELLNFLVDEGQYGLTLTADWYSIYWLTAGHERNEEDMEDFIFPATWSGGQLKGDRDHVITFTDLYEKDGKQYACGYMETASGIPAKVAMVRP